MIKNYYGEKYAFEYAYLLHYQAFLIVPSFFGVILAFYQISRFMESGDFKVALDSELNAIFGLGVAFWATVFLESWKRTQKTISFLWGCSDNSFSKQDERTDEFKSYEIFNDQTYRIEKRKREPNAQKARIYRILSYLFLLIVFVAMIIFQTVSLGAKYEFDDKGEIIGEKKDLYSKFIKGCYTAIYSGIVVVFGGSYKVLARIQTNDENHRYQKNYDDKLISRLFIFSSMNFYVPMLFIAYDFRNTRNYDDLFSLMLTQMAFKQVGLNVVEIVLPILKQKGVQQKLREEYREVINEFLPDDEKIPLDSSLESEQSQEKTVNSSVEKKER